MAYTPLTDVKNALGTTTDAVVDAGATGSQSAKLRRLTTDLNVAKTSLGTTADTPLAGETPEDATARTGISLWKRAVNKLIDIKALLVKGTAVMASAIAVTLATDDTQFGEIGAAADVDGNIHGQLRSIAEAEQAVQAAVRGVEFTAASGAALTCTVAATNYTVSVTAGSTYIVKSLDGTIKIGFADTGTVANIVYQVNAQESIAITIPTGVTDLHYQSAVALTSGWISKRA